MTDRSSVIWLKYFGVIWRPSDLEALALFQNPPQQLHLILPKALLLTINNSNLSDNSQQRHLSHKPAHEAINFRSINNPSKPAITVAYHCTEAHFFIDYQQLPRMRQLKVASSIS